MAGWLFLALPVFLACFWAGAASPLSEYNDMTEAISAGVRENKLVLLISGREDCGNCVTLEYGVLGTTNPPVRQFVEEALVYWNCHQDRGCTDCKRYTSDLTSFPIPLVCLINPNDSDRYITRGFGGDSPVGFLSYLRKTVFVNSCPVPTNLIGSVLPAQATFIQGRSRFFNLPLRSIAYRLDEEAAWHTVAAVTNGQQWATDWSIPLSAANLAPGPHTLRIFGRDNNLLYSRTNLYTYLVGSTPWVALAAPTNGQIVNTLVCRASGTAISDSPVTGIWLQVNDATNWFCAQGTTNWAADLILHKGPNTVRVCGQDQSGKFGSTNQIVLVCQARETLKAMRAASAATEIGMDGATLGQTYSLQRATALLGANTTWTEVMSVTATNPSGQLWVSMTNQPSPCFFRAVAP